MMIELQPEDVRELKTKYQECLDNNVQNFTFKGREMYVPYVKYLLEYIETLKTPVVRNSGR